MTSYWCVTLWALSFGVCQNMTMSTSLVQFEVQLAGSVVNVTVGTSAVEVTPGNDAITEPPVDELPSHAL